LDVDAELIRPLAELRREDDRRFGGKSASLGELMAGGIPVPPGFALSAQAYRNVLQEAGLEKLVARTLEGLDPEDLRALDAASNAIAGALRARPLPDALGDLITAAYEALGDAPPVAVRSSALGEDAADATFAGQQETYLWVRGAGAVCEAVRDCWASLHSPPAISYRARLARDAEEPAMGVTVQVMVDAAVSGVMFTCNPVSGDPSTVAINASWGLGQAVVGGEVTPDESRLSKVSGDILHRTVNDKHLEYVPGDSEGAVPVEVPAERRNEACLDDEQLGVLLEVGRKVERHFGSHQDIEWAIAREVPLPASLFLLQSRPVTTAPAKPSEPKPRSAMDLVMGTFGARPEGGA
jgi:pyruvate, water dikinase